VTGYLQKVTPPNKSSNKSGEARLVGVAVFGSNGGVEEELFVYGSLKRGHVHHEELKAARFMGQGCVRGYRLVLYQDSYPALVEGTGADLRVWGEVYRVSPQGIAQLDAFEECPQLYQRVRVPLEDGSQPWAYVIPQETGELYPTIGGLWEGA
jgi:gamma-glutamylcyclotransferase (GGCT)/AIG2-like uncharacterized protein YtfP